jgi:hypothetical protein
MNDQNNKNYLVFIKALARTYNKAKRSDLGFTRTSQNITFVHEKKEFEINNLPKLCIIDYVCKTEQNLEKPSKILAKFKDKFKERSDIQTIDILDFLDLQNLKTKKSEDDLQEIYEICILLCKGKLKTKVERKVRFTIQHKLNLLRNELLSLRLKNKVWNYVESSLHKELTGDKILFSYVCDNEKAGKEPKKIMKEVEKLNMEVIPGSGVSNIYLNNLHRKRKTKKCTPTVKVLKDKVARCNKKESEAKKKKNASKESKLEITDVKNIEGTRGEETEVEEVGTTEEEYKMDYEGNIDDNINNITTDETGGRSIVSARASKSSKTKKNFNKKDTKKVTWEMPVSPYDQYENILDGF